jgi:patatin-like phospholipase/acyl hydrolase
MRRIQELEDEEEIPERISGQEQVNRKLPLPCDYFDFIIGTSTGGYDRP